MLVLVLVLVLLLTLSIYSRTRGWYRSIPLFRCQRLKMFVA